MFDVYIFDLDGTLLDTLDDLTSSVNAALSAYRCPERTRDEVPKLCGQRNKALDAAGRTRRRIQSPFFGYF